VSRHLRLNHGRHASAASRCRNRRYSTSHPGDAENSAESCSPL
jgi:hypothetical protein